MTQHEATVIKAFNNNMAMTDEEMIERIGDKLNTLSPDRLISYINRYLMNDDEA